MSNILTTQPRNFVTATYVMLGTSIAYVTLWNALNFDLLTKLLIITAFGGLITPVLYYIIDPFQQIGNLILKKIHSMRVGKQFPEYQDVNYADTFGEPYFANDRNKIYGCIYILSAIVIALIMSPIPLSEIPSGILIAAIGCCVFLVVAALFLIIKQRERIKEVHYILTLERYSSIADSQGVVKAVKDDLIAERWTSAINRIKKTKEEFFNGYLKTYSRFSENKEKWQTAHFEHQDTDDPFGIKASIRYETGEYEDFCNRIKEEWLYLLDIEVKNLISKIKRLIEIVENKQNEIESVLNDKNIIMVLSDLKKEKRHRLYVNKVIQIAEERDHLYKDAGNKLQELKLIFELIVEEIKKIETCLNQLELKK